MKIATFILSFFLSFSLTAQNVWKLLQESDIKEKSSKEREIVPEKYSSFSFEFEDMMNALKKSPSEDDVHRIEKSVSLFLPYPDGSLKHFKFYESSNFSPVLQAKFPHIRSYRGYSVENQSVDARIDYGTVGFHGAINSSEGTIYIDPYFLEVDDNYISYYVKDHKIDTDQFIPSCGLGDYENAMEAELHPETNFNSKSLNEAVIKTTYRLALACTGAWGQLWSTVDNVMSRMNTGVSRINMIFENEVAVKFELIDNNEELINLSAQDDPYNSANQAPVVLGQNTGILNSIVGANAYDIGHVFTIGCIDNIAGIANPASVCQGNKGAGVSCVGTRNISFFMTQTTAHELGHQFSCGHTWSICTDRIASQFSPGTAWEPGGGSTILSYAGSCGAQNITGTNDDYFHVGSIGQIKSFMSTIESCGLREDSGNHTPNLNLNYTNGFFIPISTPFELEGYAEDIDGDILTYNWEQMNTGPSSPLGMPIANSAIFRSYPPGPDNCRIFPRIGDILSGISRPEELLPTYNRNLNFRFTVRDNHPGAGSTVWEEVAFKSSDQAGPFIVTYPNNFLSKEVGDTLKIEWDVANTDLAPVHCSSVDLYLSTNGGLDFDILLKENTPNDGSEVIIVPNNITNTARFKVKGHNNIFFNISDEILIVEPDHAAFFIDVSDNNLEFCLPDQVDVDITITGTAFQGFSNPIDLEIVSGLPADAKFSFSENPIPPDGSSILNIDLNDVLYSESFNILIQGSSMGSDTVNQIVSFDVTGTNFDEFEPLSPLSGSQGFGGTPEFSWTDVINATEYTLEVSLSPEFGQSNVIFEEGITGTSMTPQIALENSKLYYWRIAASNDCTGKIYSPIQTFGTVALSCRNFESEDLPRNISATGLPVVSSIIEVFDEGTISDVNVKQIKGVHQRVGDIKATLISPANTETVLFENRCFSSNFNVGFDSDSPIGFTCTLNNGITMRPEKGDLSNYSGESIRGEWTLKIEDTVPGEGGQFQEFSLELCSNTVLDNPYLVNNDTLHVAPGFSETILRQELLSEDNDNSAEELIYTLVVTPEKGTLFLEGIPLEIGSQFSQAELNDESISYTHSGTEDEQDYFTFTVIDGSGGWIDLSRFNINIDSGVQVSTEDIISDFSRFSIYPNPVTQNLHIHDYGIEFEEWGIQIIDLGGRVLKSDQIYKYKTLDVSELQSGIYLLRLFNKSGSLYKKISVVK